MLWLCGVRNSLQDICGHQKRGTAVENICMVSIYFRKFVYNDYPRVISICKRIHNKTSIIFLSLCQACWILMQHLQNSSWWRLVVSAPDICALFVNVPCHKRILFCRLITFNELKSTLCLCTGVQTHKNDRQPCKSWSGTLCSIVWSLLCCLACVSLC